MPNPTSPKPKPGQSASILDCRHILEPEKLDPLNWALEYHTLILFLKGAIMKYKFILLSPWLFKSPVNLNKPKRYYPDPREDLESRSPNLGPYTTKDTL